MKDDSDLKSQQIETYNAGILHISKEIKTLSTSLQEKSTKLAQLQSELQTYQGVGSTQWLGLLKLMTRVAEIECKLHEAEYQKQQVELKKEATVQEMKAQRVFNVWLHAQIGKL